MSTHIGAQPGEIAPRVLLPGDPLRAKWIAETFLEEATCYSEVRGMLGFTGSWQGHRASVQGSGMGQPSMAIYVNELFDQYDVQSIVRVVFLGLSILLLFTGFIPVLFDARRRGAHDMVARTVVLRADAVP